MKDEKFDYIKFLEHEKIKIERKYNRYKERLNYIISKIEEEKEYQKIKKDMEK